MPRSVTIELKPGITRASLPDNRVMSAGVEYTVSMETWKKISSDARRRIINVVSFNDTPSALGVDLTTNTVAVPEGHSVGKVVQGMGMGDAFMLVKVVDADVVAGDVLTWADIAAREVTRDREGGSAETPLRFAGVALGAITATRYGWIQIRGEATAKVAGDVDAGDVVGIHPTTDATLIGASENETQEVVVSDATGGTFTLTFDGQTTAAIAHNAAASAVKSALEALSNIAVGDVAVSGGPLGTAPVVVTFEGALAGTNVAEMTADGTNLTGAGAQAVAVTTTNEGVDGGEDPVGTALATPSGGTVAVDLRTEFGPPAWHRVNDLYRGR